MRRGTATPGEERRSEVSASDPQWDAEARYWRAQYLFQPYYELGRPYDFYAPAFRVGYEIALREPGAAFDDAAAEMQRRLGQMRHHPDLDGSRAEPAARAAWLRVERGRRRLT
jgi:hypothetical protein